MMWIIERVSTCNNCSIKAWISVRWNNCFLCGFFRYLRHCGRTFYLIVFRLTRYILRGVDSGSVIQVKRWWDNIVNVNVAFLNRSAGIISVKNICRSCKIIITLNIWITDTFFCINIILVSTRGSHVFINNIYWIFDVFWVGLFEVDSVYSSWEAVLSGNLRNLYLDHFCSTCLCVTCFWY